MPSMIYGSSTGFQIEPAIATKDDILRAIAKYYTDEDGLEELMVTLNRDVNNEEETVDQDSPVVRLVNQLLSNAVDA